MMRAPRFWMVVPALLMGGMIGLVSAKLPPPDDAAKAKAAEAKAKAAETAKKERLMEEKAMDRVAARYKREKGNKTAPASVRK